MTSTINTSMGAREWAMLVTLSVLWGGSFFFVGVVVSDLPPLTIVTLRVGLAALALWSIALVMGLRPPGNLGVWLTFFGMGLLNNVILFTLIVWGQTHIASGFASILNATTPLFTVIVAGLLLPDERATPMKLVGVVVGFGGIVVMFGSTALVGGSSALAQTAVLGAAISYAFAGVYGRRFKRMGVNPIHHGSGTSYSFQPDYGSDSILYRRSGRFACAGYGFVVSHSWACGVVHSDGLYPVFQDT
jgi:drug/metabolite transporter (DMT)-like permease